MHSTFVCVLLQISSPPLLLSPSILSTVSNHVDMEHDISPDSGHRELSTDSLSTSANTQSDASWHSALAASTTYHQELVSRLRDTMLSSPTYPITSCHISSITQPSMSDTSNLVQLDSPAHRRVSHAAADIGLKVLKNSATENSGLTLPADSKTSLSIVDKSLLHSDAQFFMNEDSMAGGQDGKCILKDQLT